MKENPTPVHIAIAFDEDYIAPVYVLLTSIFINNRECRFKIHAIATNVLKAEKAKKRNTGLRMR